MKGRMIEAIKAITGVDSVGSVNYPPLEPPGSWQGIVYTDTTADLSPSNAAADPYMYNVSPDYFRASGTSLLAGRALSLDEDTTPPAGEGGNRGVPAKTRAPYQRLFRGASQLVRGHAQRCGGVWVSVQ